MADGGEDGAHHPSSATIRLENSIFTGLPGGKLTAAALTNNIPGISIDAQDRVICESDAGKLYFNRDGTGSAAKSNFATIGMNLALANADFFVF